MSFRLSKTCNKNIGYWNYLSKNQNCKTSPKEKKNNICSSTVGKDWIIENKQKEWSNRIDLVGHTIIHVHRFHPYKHSKGRNTLEWQYIQSLTENSTTLSKKEEQTTVTNGSFTQYKILYKTIVDNSNNNYLKQTR